MRIDWFTFADVVEGLVDLKTCRDLDSFEFDARAFEYVHQLTFYRSVVWQVLGDLVPVHLIAVEKNAPYRTGVWRVGQDVLARAQQENEGIMKRLRKCQQTDHWPTGFEDVRVLDRL